jgi:hypothetical protein
MSKLTRFTALLLTVALSGCALSAPRATPVNACGVAGDCGEGAMCVEARCVAQSSATTAVVLTAIPAENDSQRAFAPVTLPQEVVRSQSTVDVTLARSREVTGVVRAPPGSREPFVNALVRFVRSGTNEAGVSVFSSATEDETTSGFSVFLATGTYDVFIEPRVVATPDPMNMQQTRPPLIEREFLVVNADAVSSEPQRHNLVYGEPLVVSGFIVDRDLGAGVGELLVRAVDSRGALISTRGTTATGNGAFNIGIMLDQRSPEWFLEVSTGDTPSTTAAARMPPTTARMVYRIASSALVSGGGALTGLQVRIPGLQRLSRTPDGACVGCVDVEATVERAVRSPDAPSGLLATIYMRGQLEQLPMGHQAWFEVLARSTASGSITTAVLPGNYQVIITPEDEAFALTQSTLRVSTMVRGRTFSVPLRPVLQGSLRAETSRSVGMGGVEIEARPLDASTLNLPVATARATTSVTDATGRFSLELDPGRYVIVARPDPSTGFAAVVHPTPVEVRMDTARAELALVARPPLTLRGRVNTPGSSLGAPGARVRAFGRVAYESQSAMMSTIDVPVAEDVADRTGLFELLLPVGLSASAAMR